MKFAITLSVFILSMLSSKPVMPQSHFEMAAYYAPVIYQDVMCTRFGDYITRVDYDGDYIGNNNWNNLAKPNSSITQWTKARPLRAYVYYSIVESITHHFITYALFHPADDFHCHTFSHENDLEGIVLTVRKDGTLYGSLRMVHLQAHNDFYQYTRPGSTGISNRYGTIDGTIILEGARPRVYVEGGGHGIRHRKTGGAPSVIYRYGGRAEDPDDVGYNSVSYDLLSIFSEFWELRNNCCGSGYLFDDRGDYRHISGIGRKFDGNDGSDDAASPPWNWNDNDDIWWAPGDWFMDPAQYQFWQFNWSEPFETSYIVHPFLRSDLPDTIYNGANGKTTLHHGPYDIVRDVRVIEGQTLEVTSGRTIFFADGRSIRARGTVRLVGQSAVTSLRVMGAPQTGITNSATIVLKNGGTIKLKLTL